MVDQLADLIRRGWHIPFTQYRVIQGREADQLVERMRINVPSAIRESERTLADRDRILAEAKAEADRIVEEARQRAMEMVTERALLDTARLEMQRIVEEGQADAQRRVAEADTYALGVLQGLRDELRTLSHQVDNGIVVMGGRTESSKQDAPGPSSPSGKRKK